MEMGEMVLLGAVAVVVFWILGWVVAMIIRRVPTGTTAGVLLRAGGVEASANVRRKQGKSKPRSGS